MAADKASATFTLRWAVPSGELKGEIRRMSFVKKYFRDWNCLSWAVIFHLIIVIFILAALYYFVIVKELQRDTKREKIPFEIN